jgi:hypothetical protein
MQEELEGTEGGLSRRKLLVGAGLLAAGAVGMGINPMGVLAGANEAEASAAAYPWPYKKLDIAEAGRLAYEGYYPGMSCSYATLKGIFPLLAKSVGEPYRSFPIEGVQWGVGGVVGWGTLCGTLMGAGLAIGLIAGDGAEAIINDLMFWYSETELPIFNPGKLAHAELKVRSVSGSPLCHLSTAKWMSRAGVGYKDPLRIDRCARVAADVAMQTATRLNKWVAGEYRPENKRKYSITEFGLAAQTNCAACHENGVPKLFK